MKQPVRRPISALLAAVAVLAGGLASTTVGAVATTSSAESSRLTTGEAMLLSKRYVGEDEEYHYQLWLRDASGDEQAVVTDPFTKPFFADLSPDGRKVVYTVGAGSTLPASGLFVVGSDGSGRRNLLAGNTPINTAREPEWSPDGKRIVFTAISKKFTDDLWTVKADGTGLTRITDCNCTRFAAPTWAPDGTRVAYTSEIYDLAVVDVASGQSTPLATGKTVNDYAWHPQDDWIVFSAAEAWNSVDQVLWAIPASGGTPTLAVRREGMSLSSPHYPSDGTRLGFIQQSFTYDDALTEVAWIDGDGAVQVLPDTPYLDDLLDWGKDCRCTPGGRFSSITVRAKTMSDHLQVAGGVLPGLTGAPVKVVVQRSSTGKRWRQVQALTVRTSELSTFYTPTKRAAGQLCRVTVSWAGDSDHDPVRARTRPLGC